MGCSRWRATSRAGKPPLVDWPACAEQEAGSPFLTNLNDGGDPAPGVGYTVIETDNDEVVTPYPSAFLSGPNVTNIPLQTQCPLDQGDHLPTAYDYIADADVLTALDPADPQHPACAPVLPVLGGCARSAVVGGDHAQRKPVRTAPNDMMTS